jgi:poly-gamma-glutamate synthesis protein (capsule biosynthesis protein)
MADGRRSRIGLVAIVLASLFAALPGFAATCPEGDGRFGAGFYPGPYLFETAIAAESDYPQSKVRLSGITVPHHLVVPRLIARGFRAATGFDYDRVILLAPDHFLRLGDAAFATTRRGFDTVLGPVDVDVAATEALIANGAADTCLFAEDHGVLALLPFLRHALPEAKLVPVAISIRSKREDWDRLVALLRPLAGQKTLIVQSTDFSHYHPHGKARAFDQQTLNLIAEGDLDRISRLNQPDHLDSIASMYVQMRLQREVHGASPVVLASENQQEHTRARLAETTSYKLIAFGRFGATGSPHEPEAEVYYLAGDAHFGRAMTQALTDADAAERVAQAVLARTGGRPMIVNLEGVILPNVPESLAHMTIAMPQELAIPWLKRLNVAAVGLANNHALDLGEAGLDETLAALDKAGIAHFAQGERLDIGRLSIVGLSDLDSNGPPYTGLVTPQLLDRLIVEDATRPVIAFTHWGREYVTQPSARETELAEEMRLRGATVIAGAHPHVADGRLATLGGGETIMAYSLGNFLFDQTATNASGKLLELRAFKQGTVYARLIDLPNLFDLTRPGNR